MALPQTAVKHKPPARTPERLRGMGLWLARGLILALTLVNLYFALSTIPSYYRQVADLQVDTFDLGSALRDWNAANLRAAAGALGLSLQFIAVLSVVCGLLVIFSFLVIGALIFWRKSDTWLGLLAGYVLMNLGMGLSGLPMTADTTSQLSGTLFSLSGMMWPAFFILLTLFPDGRFVPGWMRFGALGIFLIFGAATLFPNGIINDPFFGFVVIILIILCLLSQPYRYFKASGPVERQQMRWFVAGVLAFMLYWIPNFPPLSLHARLFPVLTQFGPTQLIYDLIYGVFGRVVANNLLPLALAIALFRYHLWDLGLIIRRTLVYGLLTLMLGLVYFGAVVVLQNFFGAAFGRSSPVMIVFSTLLIAALANPLRRALQDRIDRRFYRQRYNAEKALTSFSSALRSEVDLESLSDRILTTGAETMQPESISLWLRADKSADLPDAQQVALVPAGDVTPIR